MASVCHLGRFFFEGGRGLPLDPDVLLEVSFSNLADINVPVLIRCDAFSRWVFDISDPRAIFGGEEP